MDGSNVVQSLLGHITQEPILDPVSTEYGHTYARSAVEPWLQTSAISPVTGAPLQTRTVVANHAMRNVAGQVRERSGKIIPACDLELGTGVIGSGAFKTVTQGLLKRIPGAPNRLRIPLTVAVLQPHALGTGAEANIMAGFADHPRLVRYFGTCEELERPCLVTEFASMGSMRDEIQRIADVITVAHDVAVLQPVSFVLQGCVSTGYRDVLVCLGVGQSSHQTSWRLGRVGSYFTCVGS